MSPAAEVDMACARWQGGGSLRAAPRATAAIDARFPTLNIMEKILGEVRDICTCCELPGSEARRPRHADTVRDRPGRRRRHSDEEWCRIDTLVRRASLGADRPRPSAPADPLSNPPLLAGEGMCRLVGSAAP
jgi:hypothetical protein